jgi:hypothetical protein
VAAALAPSMFVYGAAYTHVEDYLRTGNDAPMNWSLAAVGANILIPTAILGLVWIYWRQGGFGTPDGESRSVASDQQPVSAFQPGQRSSSSVSCE